MIWIDYNTKNEKNQLLNSKKPKELSGKVYHFVSVCFEENGRCYDYLCDDESVKVGDKVIVKGYDGEKAVKVVAVTDKYESQLGLPREI